MKLKLNTFFFITACLLTYSIANCFLAINDQENSLMKLMYNNEIDNFKKELTENLKNYSERQLSSLLHTAATQNKFEFTKFLISIGAKEGYDSILQGVNNKDILKLLLENKADVNKNVGGGLIIRAAMDNQCDVVLMLASFGAKYDGSKRHRNILTLDHFYRKNQDAIVSILIQYFQHKPATIARLNKIMDTGKLDEIFNWFYGYGRLSLDQTVFEKLVLENAELHPKIKTDINNARQLLNSYRELLLKLMPVRYVVKLMLEY